MSNSDRETERLRRLILDETRILRPPLAPELRMYGADDYAVIWSATEARLEALGLPPPFWAFPWVGGQALARYLLDRPDVARGRRVLAIGAGAGLEAIAAAKAGAASTTANDIDRAACVAASMNAALNGATVATCGVDLLEAPEAGLLEPGEADLLLLGDALYEKDVSTRLLGLLAEAADRGALVLIGEPGRGFAPTAGTTRLARYRVPVSPELEDCDHRDVAVLRLDPRRPDGGAATL